MRTKSSASKLAKKSLKLREKRFPDFAIYKNLVHIPLNIPKRSFHVFSRHDHPPIHLPSIIPRRLILLPLPNFSHSKIPSPKTSSLFGRLRLIKYSRAGEMRRRACGAFPLSLFHFHHPFSHPPASSVHKDCVNSITPAIELQTVSRP